jgi:hypothetical protein
MYIKTDDDQFIISDETVEYSLLIYNILSALFTSLVSKFLRLNTSLTSYNLLIIGLQREAARLNPLNNPKSVLHTHTCLPLLTSGTTSHIF